MPMPKLIFCGGNNCRYWEIAMNNNLLYGCRLPNEIPCGSIYFSDQDWKHPKMDEYLSLVARYTPVMATILDWEKESQFDEIILYAERISSLVEKIIIIPKIPHIDWIPKYINNTPIVLGYSVPTNYGHTRVSISNFSGWDVHLLGGSPHRQYNYYRRLKKHGANVISIDQNYILLKANNWCEYWTGKYDDNRWWRSVFPKKIDNIYTAFDLSCKNLISYWNDFWDWEPPKD